MTLNEGSEVRYPGGAIRRIDGLSKFELMYFSNGDGPYLREKDTRVPFCSSVPRHRFQATSRSRTIPYIHITEAIGFWNRNLMESDIEGYPVPTFIFANRLAHLRKLEDLQDRENRRTELIGRNRERHRLEGDA